MQEGKHLKQIKVIFNRRLNHNIQDTTFNVVFFLFETLKFTLYAVKIYYIM